MKTLLIIEDDPDVRLALERLIARHGYEVYGLSAAEAILAGPLLPACDLVLDNGKSIMDLPGVSAPRVALPDLIEPYLAVRRLAALGDDASGTTTVRAGLIGQCPPMRELLARIDKVAPTDATVLILGESGTGKDLVAQALHEQSRRAARPFVAVNCAAIPEQRVECELFGYASDGSRPQPGLVQQADGGTLFLDEVGELPAAAQARLLRVIQGGECINTNAGQRPLDVRILAATHRDLRQLVQAKAFRSDLYFRLRVIELRLPPLRERGDDVHELARFLLARSCRAMGRSVPRLSREALEALRHYAWPGNVRELANAIERSVILDEADLITPELLAIDHQVLPPADFVRTEVDALLSLEEYFRRFVLTHQGSMTETELAGRLGISRKALWERRQRLGLPRPGRQRSRG